MGHIKIEAKDDLKASIGTPRINQATKLEGGCHDGCLYIPPPLKRTGAASSHKAVVMDDKKVGKALPWMHIAISNAKRSIPGK